MRIRFSITLDIDRAAKEVPSAPEVDDKGFASTELSEIPRVGFSISPSTPEERHASRRP